MCIRDSLWAAGVVGWDDRAAGRCGVLGFKPLGQVASMPAGMQGREDEELRRSNVFKWLEARPSVLNAREIGEHIVERMREYVEVFLRGMVA